MVAFIPGEGSSKLLVRLYRTCFEIGSTHLPRLIAQVPFCCVIDDHAVRGVPVVFFFASTFLRVYSMCFNAVRGVPVVASLRLDIIQVL